MIADATMFADSRDPLDASSPALRAGHQPDLPAFELKFVVEEATAARFEARVQTLCRDDGGLALHVDPHGDPARGGTYRVHTVYLDTPTLDVLHRTPGFRRRKHRLRRYDDDDLLHLERKSKQQDRVRKQRVAVPAADHVLLAQPVAPGGWAGADFHEDVHRLGLTPSAEVTYVRQAWFGTARSGALRITLDRDLAGGPASSWLPAVSATHPSVAPTRLPARLPSLLAGFAVLEMKFEAALPPPLQRLLGEFRLQPTSLSKYRLSRSPDGSATLHARVSGTNGRA